MGLIGPGDAGSWTPEREDDEFDGGFVRHFASEVQVGDVVLLRTGVQTIYAIGIVASDYLYLSQFDDVNGWPLQHARRVRWYRLPQDYTFESQVFGANPTRFSRCWKPEVKGYVEKVLSSPIKGWQTAPLPELPSEEPPLEVVPEALRNLVGEASDLYPQFWDRERFGERPSEDELIAHLVVPFLRALGWLPEQIAVKWRSIDVAVFHELPRMPGNCRFLIEAKRLGEGIEGALEQAAGYVSALGIKPEVVVTDGFRYRVYSSAPDFSPLAYANIVKLKRSADVLFERLRRS